ncbi:MAG TPA: hypothetical protein VK816_00345 [Jatrophihabitantaceae bacterium]|jgi:hypothetical protein|nr:hypothetical protein [Jatrophihabitantaceae bacterium]
MKISYLARPTPVLCVLAAALAVGMSAGTAGATAVPPTTSTATPSVHPTSAQQRAVAAEVLGSANPASTYQRLSPTDRATFDSAQTQVRATDVVTRSGRRAPTAAEIAAGAPSATSPVASSLALAAQPASGCWYYYRSQNWSDFDLREGTTWLQLDWCAAGGRITSWNIADRGGQGSLFNYDGLGASGANNVGWEVRVYQQYKFSVGPKTFQPCMQIRGGATGLYSSPTKSCNLN